ncbi:unnamed protein product [Leptidea sinapis]|uniref:Uncharacterized protein n=1 Tax=Leptidea sinapis TaxID=189913 RepID=A0A5E4PU14_9NEOP|nr:unnamed protein product [Leptidea sinapis]
MAVKYMKNAPYLTFIIATIYLAIKKLRVCTLIKGAWGPRVARFAGIPALPLVPFKHAYVVSEGIPEIRNAPNLRDHDVNLYIKIQGESCHIGGYENNPLILDQCRVSVSNACQHRSQEHCLRTRVCTIIVATTPLG